MAIVVFSVNIIIFKTMLPCIILTMILFLSISNLFAKSSMNESLSKEFISTSSVICTDTITVLLGYSGDGEVLPMTLGEEGGVDEKTRLGRNGGLGTAEKSCVEILVFVTLLLAVILTRLFRRSFVCVAIIHKHTVIEKHINNRIYFKNIDIAVIGLWSISAFSGLVKNK